MVNEKILIFGDSYSTFEGHIPEGYLSYYPEEGDESVCDASRTWWYMLAKETLSEIVLNNSWSGSTMCNTGYHGDCSTTSSFIHRLEELIKNDFFVKNEIDRVFVFGGTNDSWTGNECGEPKYSDWSVDDLFLILPGISFFVEKLQSVVPKDKIHIIINTELRTEVRDGILDICKRHKIAYTLLEDIDKVSGHPTYKGMTEIKDQILASLGE